MGGAFDSTHASGPLRATEGSNLMLDTIASSATNWLIMLAILVGLVIAHELGHFAVARRLGVKVPEFGIFMPPRVRTMFTWKGTAFTLNALPLGGFVKLHDEHGDSADPQGFVAQPLYKRVIILAAGVSMNFLVAILIFAAIAFTGSASTTIHIGALIKDPSGVPSPAQIAGLVDDSAGANAGDTILGIDGHLFMLGNGDGITKMLGYLRERPGQTVVLNVKHADGVSANIPVTLRQAADITPTKGALGIGGMRPGFGEKISYGPVESIVQGVQMTFGSISQTLGGLGDLVSNIGAPQVTGPIGIATAVGEVRAPDAPPNSIWFLIAILSANLAVVNILPIPPMDGGRIFTSVVRAASRNRLGAKFELRMQMAGLVGVLALFLWITWNDILRLINPGA
jgi:regulator of sigma E protease